MTLLAPGVGSHAGRPVATAGPPLGEAGSAVILVHGRGGDAAEMLSLGQGLAPPAMLCLAPQATDHVWYPHRFIEPVSRNEPDLSSALSVLGGLIDLLVEGGLPARRIAILGFSQGACLALEAAVRRARPLGAVLGLSGGLIGDRVVAPDGAGSPLDGMPVLLGCSERDAHIPLGRVRETDMVLRALGARVTTRIYPGDGHTVTDDEVGIAREMLERLA